MICRREETRRGPRQLRKSRDENAFVDRIYAMENNKRLQIPVEFDGLV
jgi:hypothetical protein